MKTGVIEIYREIKEGGVVMFTIVCFIGSLVYSTYRSENRADNYVRVMADERIETNKILSEISATMKSIQNRLDVVEYRIKNGKYTEETKNRRDYESKIW